METGPSEKLFGLEQIGLKHFSKTWMLFFFLQQRYGGMGILLPKPETQTFSILMLIFMGSPSKPQHISTTVAEAPSPVSVSCWKAFKDQTITQRCFTHQNVFPPNASAPVPSYHRWHANTWPSQSNPPLRARAAGPVQLSKLRFVSRSAWNDWMRAEQTKTKHKDTLQGSHGLCFM